MKGHKANHHERHHRKMGGHAQETPEFGKREYEEDLDGKTPSRVSAEVIDKAAEERKHGGRAKRKRGGHVHHEHGKHLGHAKHVGHVVGHEGHHHAGRKPRKAGGRAGGGSNEHPLSSAHNGILPPHQKDVKID
jgi:hypothetical protein